MKQIVLVRLRYALKQTHLQEVSVTQQEAAGHELDPLSIVSLDAVNALVVVVIVSRVVRGQKNSFGAYRGGAALGWTKPDQHSAGKTRERGRKDDS